MELVLWLPLPPSVNGLFATDFRTKRRFPSKKYNEWKADAKIALAQQRPVYKVPGPIIIAYEFGRPSKRKTDLLNREKACTDFLVSEDLIDDDSLIEEATLRWVDGLVGTNVTVRSID